MKKFRLFVREAGLIGWFGLVVTACLLAGGGYIMGTYSILKGLPLVITAIAIPIVAYFVASRRSKD